MTLAIAAKSASPANLDITIACLHHSHLHRQPTEDPRVPGALRHAARIRTSETCMTTGT